MAVQRSLSRFEGPPIPFAKKVEPSYTDRIAFTVDHDDVYIWGAGLYGNPVFETIVRLELLEVSPRLDKKASAVCPISPVPVRKASVVGPVTYASSLEFEEGVLVQSSKRYILEASYQAVRRIFRGTYEHDAVLCTDGPKFTFSQPVPNPFINVDEKVDEPIISYQFPWILYSRSSASSCKMSGKPGMSFQESSIEVPIFLDQGDFTSVSQQVKLHHYTFSASVERKGKRWQVTLSCLPLSPSNEWSIETETNCAFIQTNAESESKAIKARSSFDYNSTSSLIVSADTNSIFGESGNQVCTLMTLIIVIRYQKGKTLKTSPVDETQDFRKPWRNSDVILVCDDGTELHGHSTVLALASPVFRQKVEGYSKETLEKRIAVKGQKKALLSNFLRVLYPGMNPLRLDETLALDLVELFHEFAMAALEREAEKVLVEHVGKNTALRYITVAVRFGLVDLTERCLEVAVTMTGEKIKTDSAYYHLNNETKSLIQDARMKAAGLS